MDEMPDVDPVYHRKLFQITDRLNRAYLDPEDMDVANFTALLRELCSALRKSINADVDQLFRAAAGLTNRAGLQIEAAAAVKDAAVFAKFIEFEVEVLRDCGVSEAVARHVTSNVARLREQLTRPTIDPALTMAALRRFQDDVCIAADQANADFSRRERRHKIKVGATIASGFCLSLANGIAIAKSGGLFVPFGTLSIVSGGMMVTMAPRFTRPGERKPKKRD